MEARGSDSGGSFARLHPQVTPRPTRESNPLHGSRDTMLGAQRRRLQALPEGQATALADEAERFRPAGALGLTRCSLLLALQGEHDSFSRAAQLCDTLSWAERELRWYPPTHVSLLSPTLHVRCSLLLRQGGDEPGAEFALERRASALLGAPCRVVAASALPLPPPFQALTPLGVSPPPPLPLVLELLRSRGFAELQPSLGTEELFWLLRHASERVSIASAALHQQSFTPFEDDFAFADTAARSKGRIELRLPLPSAAGASSDAGRLLALASHGPWARIARAALRDANPLVTASVIVSRPGAPHQAWHADGPHPEQDAARLRRAAWSATEMPDAPRRPAPSPPTALCCFVPLRSLTSRLGGTALWLGSHALGCGAVEVACAGAVELLGSQTPLPPAGGALLYDYRLIHRGEANVWQPGDGGENGLRPLLQFVFRKRAEGGWAERQNFLSGETLLPAGPGETLDAVALHAEDETAAAEGAAWWAEAYEELVETTTPAPSAALPSAAGWDVFA